VTDGRWPTYYTANEGRPPRAQLLEVLEAFPLPGEAVDLGCGAGIDTAAMLDRGWSVFATDAEAEGLERLRRRVGDAHGDRLRIQHARMEDVALPPADLVWASYSLFFCEPARFGELWDRIFEAVRPGGWFAGQILGERDAWAGTPGISSFTLADAMSLFEGWEVRRFQEEDEDGEACSGPKHWHVFHVTARRAPHQTHT
jgi:tellurite methyltransferase